MANNLRKTGIEQIGKVPWGTHFCQFYQDKQDLVNILVPYFKTGLENNEFCLWVVSRPLSAVEAQEKMAKVISDFPQYLKKKQIEIIPDADYCTEGILDIRRVLDSWAVKLRTASTQGFAGLRLSLSPPVLVKNGEKSITELETAVNDTIGKCKMLTLCTYNLRKCRAAEITDIIGNHEFTLIKKAKQWELVQRSKNKATEKALIESEKLVDRLVKEVQMAFDSMEDMVSIQDRDFNLVRVNKAFENAVKMKREELLGKKCYEVIHRSNWPVENCPHKETLETKKSITREVFEPRRGKHFEVSTSPIFDEKGEIWGSIHIVKDITERKREEENLRQSEERMRLKLDSVLSPHVEIGNLDLASIIDISAFQSLLDDLYDVTRMGIGIIDVKGKVWVQTGWQDICTKFHRVNPHTCQNCIESDVVLTRDLKPGEYRVYKCKNNLWDVVTPIFIEDKHIANVFTGQFFYEDESIDYDFFASQAEKYGFDKKEYLAALRRVPLWSREKVKSLMAFYVKIAQMISDLGLNNLKLAKAIVEQKRIERTLKESQQDLNHAQEVSHTGSWRLDLNSNSLLWSDETYRIFGISREEPMTYEKFLSTIYPEDREYVNLKWSTALKGEVYDIVHRILAEDQVKWVHERSVLEFDEQGRLKSGFGTVQDITELKRAEESLKRYTQELEATNKELEAFSYSVSHDLRQPLRALDGFSQAVIEDYADNLDQKGKDYLNRIRSASQRMSDLINDILKLSRITRAEIYPERINLSNLALSFSGELQALQTEHKIDFVVQPDITADGDRQLLRIALRNLLENAWKFTSKCSQPRIEFGVIKKNGEKVYFIKDNGAGFDMQYAHKLFEPFQRLHSDKEFRGAGIGLAIVRRIIHRHGGRIWAESETGKGAAFFFTLG